MLNEITFQKLEHLKLNGMLRALKNQLETPAFSDLTFEERLGMLIDTEFSDRENKKIGSLVKNASLRHLEAAVEQVIYTPERNIEKSQFVSLSACNWIRQKKSVIISGPSGAGKSWLACALGRQACRNGFKTYFTTATQLYDKMQVAIADQSIIKFKSKISKYELLIIDDFGLGGISANLAPTLLDMIDQQSINGAIIFTSQIPPDNWYDLFTDPTIADAFLDRILHRSTYLYPKGESLRKRRFSDEEAK